MKPIRMTFIALLALAAAVLFAVPAAFADSLEPGVQLSTESSYSQLVVKTRGNDITFSSTGKDWVYVSRSQYTITGGTKKNPQVITFKPGKYIVPRQVLESNVKIVAKGATLRVASAGGFYVGGELSAGKGGYSHIKNVTIDGGKYQIRPENSTGSIMKISHAKNITLKNFSINNCYGAHFIELIGAADSKIENVKLTGAYTGDATNEAIQLDNALNAQIAPNCMPFDGTPCKNVVVRGCKINVPAMPYGIGTNYAHAKESTNITVEKCDILVKTNAVALMATNDCTVKNNVFRKVDMKLHPSMRNLKVSGNKYVSK